MYIHLQQDVLRYTADRIQILDARVALLEEH